MSQPIKRTFAVFVEDKPGVLNRVASLFRRRSFNIDSLNVGNTHEAGVSRMTIVCEADEDKAKRIEANLYKQVNVLWIDDLTEKQSIDRVLALIKLNAPKKDHKKVAKICAKFGAQSVDSSEETLTIEITAPKDQVESLVNALEPFNILELVQTGTVSMTRGIEKHDRAHPTVTAARIEAV